jgi:hypothetical protein
MKHFDHTPLVIAEILVGTNHGILGLLQERKARVPLAATTTAASM